MQRSHTVFKIKLEETAADPMLHSSRSNATVEVEQCSEETPVWQTYSAHFATIVKRQAYLMFDEPQCVAEALHDVHTDRLQRPLCRLPQSRRVHLRPRARSAGHLRPQPRALDIFTPPPLSPRRPSDPAKRSRSENLEASPHLPRRCSWSTLTGGRGAPHSESPLASSRPPEI